MAGCLCVWWWNGRHARAHLGAALAALLLCLPVVSPPALANPDQQGGEQRDGQSRHEQERVEHITLTTEEGEVIVHRLVLIQSTSVHTASAAGGIRFESLDRVDVSGIPLLGGLFKKPLTADDLSADNRVGTVYSAGDGTLAAVVSDGIELSDTSISIVSGKGRFELLTPPQIATVVPADLGPFGELPSVRTVLKSAAPSGTLMVLGGLTRSSLPEVDSGLPVLGDIPLLRSFFRGSVHQRNENELLILIKPSVIIQEED